MKKYLSELHSKSPSHKKNFSLLVAGGTTLFIFAIWTVVKFGGDATVVAQDLTGPVNLAAVQTGPIEDIWDSIKDSWSSLLNVTNGGEQ